MASPQSLKIGALGVRGVVGESLTPQVVTSFAAAFGTYCGAGPIVVGTDARPSREMLQHAVVSGLLSVGCTPVTLGVVPTPVLQHHVRSIGAFGGVAISAGHRPLEWNALRFFGADGAVLRGNQATELTDLYHQGLWPRVAAEHLSRARADDSALARHRESVLRAVEADLIRARRFKVVVDACNGAAAAASPALLDALGCQVTLLHGDPGATFPRDPEPRPAALGALCEAVRASGADLGFAQDPDADRLTLVDEQGTALVEDCTFALAARQVLRHRPGPVVANVSTSRMIDDVAAACGSTVVRTRVGEANVLEAMARCGAALGGEGNGGVILPAVNPCRDSLVAMALILNLLAAEQRSLSAVRAEVPTYAMARADLDFAPREIAPALRQLRRRLEGGTVDLTDGLTIRWDDRWLQARPSATQPAIRVAAEAPTAAEADSLLAQVVEILRPAR